MSDYHDKVIQELQTKLDKYKWIKCSDRLPERGQRVLVVRYTGYLSKTPHIQIGVWDDYLTGELLCFSENGYVMPTQPILWKSLPIAPGYDAVKE